MRLIVLLLLLTMPMPAMSLDIIVDRRGDSIELFFSLPAADAQTSLGTDLSQIKGLTTGVDYTVLQQGTWNQGEALFANLRAQTAGKPQPFEAMSMMVHPIDTALPFRDPHEAMTAISVCGVEIPDIPPPLGDMHVYAGFIAYPVDSSQNLTLNLGNTVEIPVTVLDFNGSVVAQTEILLPPGALLNLSAPSRTPIWPFLALTTLALLTSLTFASLMWRQRKSALA